MICSQGYGHIIGDMTWSFSRVSSFDDCPYQWFLKYIYECEDKGNFYASFGKLMHSILEKYYTGQIRKEDMISEFLIRYRSEIKDIRPSPEISKNYLDAGISYLNTFSPLPYKPIWVEKRVEFYIGDIPFVGYVDYLGEKDGEYFIVDHKSRNLKPRSKRKSETLNDKQIDIMMRQLYLYSTAVKDSFGKFPKSLAFNCFRNGNYIEEPFSQDKYNETISWATEEIRWIQKSDFPPKCNFFMCKSLCGVKEDCCYYELMEGRNHHY